MDKNEAILLVNRHVRDLTTYDLEPLSTRIKLNQNENPNDWPPEIKDEIARFCKERPWNRYPNFVPKGLMERLSEYTGHPVSGILAGNGSNEMILAIVIAFVNEQAGAVICQPTFTIYQQLINGLGKTPFTVPLKADFSFDIERIIETITRHPGSVLILCSPNNPTGSTLDEIQLRRILDAHAGVLVLDQAYIEFGGFNAIPLLKDHPNLIITRTFSKAMAGAGLRLGYMLGTPEIIREINKIKLPYNINFFSEHVAEVLLSNTDYVKRRISEIIEERESLYAFFKKLPLDNVYPSGANFLLIRCKRKAELFTYLVKSGILVRDVSNHPTLENCLRMSAGAKEENRELLKAMNAFFGMS